MVFRYFKENHSRLGSDDEKMKNRPFLGVKSIFCSSEPRRNRFFIIFIKTSHAWVLMRKKHDFSPFLAKKGVFWLKRGCQRVRLCGDFETEIRNFSSFC
jgi:hypothetical protein